MATMNVSLPDEMKTWVEQQAATGRFANASDYVRDPIREDQDKSIKIAQMQALVNEAIESGVTKNSMDDILTHARSLVETS